LPHGAGVKMNLALICEISLIKGVMKMIDRRSQESTVPDTAIKVMELNDWMIYRSPDGENVYFYPASYHPKVLCLSRGQLMNLLEKAE